MFEKTEGAIKNGQSRNTDNIWLKTQNEDKHRWHTLTPPKNGVHPRCMWRVSSYSFLQDSCRTTHSNRARSWSNCM